MFLIRGREERCLLSSSRSCGRTQRTWKCWHSQMEEALGRACAGGGGGTCLALACVMREKHILVLKPLPPEGLFLTAASPVLF